MYYIELFDGKIYMLFVWLKGEIIATKRMEKAIEDFIYDQKESMYYKYIDCDIANNAICYLLDFYYKYKINENSFEYFLGNLDLINKSIELVSSDFQEGWKMEDRYLFTKTIRIEEVDAFYYQKKYMTFDKNKNMYSYNGREEFVELSLEDFSELYKKYYYENV